MEAIRKRRPVSGVKPNLVDYDRAVREFSWGTARDGLDGLPSGGINIAHECVDRHAAGPRADHTALRCLARRDGKEFAHDVSYAELAAATSRFANVLRTLDIRAGERVFALAPRGVPLYVAALGTLKARCVFSPLFPAFGPEPIRTRLALGAASALVTTAALYERKIAPLRASLPQLRHVLLIDGDAAAFAHPGVHDFAELLAAASPGYLIEPTDSEEPALLHFTSGTTGTPKGAVHVHGAVVAHHATGRMVLDLHHDDVFWCTADPGWVTGTSYGIVAPLSNGVTVVVDPEEFDAARWYEILEREAVNIWYTAPTAIRMLMKAGDSLARARSFPALRFAASVGEPLNPEAVVWGERVLGLPFHDNWWQTETGGIMIANFACLDVKPGSMGKPVPGIEAAIVRSGVSPLELVTEPDVAGELALKPGWPSMFRGYLGEDERYRKCFRDGWYLTGDLARRDADGYYWFVGRADDVIKSAGHLIGPFEVESVLMEHAAVAEAGVIGKPDATVMEVVKGFVSLRAGFEPSEVLRREILAHARRRLGPAVAPREIEFLPGLPKTRSGKIMRRMLKARELGLPLGDTSTLEEEPAAVPR